MVIRAGAGGKGRKAASKTQGCWRWAGYRTAVLHTMARMPPREEIEAKTRRRWSRETTGYLARDLASRENSQSKAQVPGVSRSSTKRPRYLEQHARGKEEAPSRQREGGGPWPSLWRNRSPGRALSTGMTGSDLSFKRLPPSHEQGDHSESHCNSSDRRSELLRPG